MQQLMSVEVCQVPTNLLFLCTTVMSLLPAAQVARDVLPDNHNEHVLVLQAVLILRTILVHSFVSGHCQLGI